MKRRRRRKTSLYKRLLIVFIELIIVLNILRYAAYFKKDIDDGKIHLILDNEIVENLQNDIYVDDNDIVYLSEDDVKEFFDENIYEEKNEDKIKLISTYENKIMTILEGENHIFVNGVRVKIKGSLIKKDDEYYLPISELQNIYGIELNYVKDNRIVDVEYLSNEKETAQINKDINLKYKMTSISRNLKELSQGETVTIIEDKKGSWTRVKTKDGYIGYVKDNRLSNKEKVRDNLEKIKYDNIDVNSEKISTLTREDYEEEFEELIINSDLRKEVIDKIVDTAITNQLEGVKISINDIKNTENYYRFLTELKPYLHDYGMCLIVEYNQNLDKDKLEKVADIIV